MTNVDIVVLTALGVEHDAVRRHLDGARPQADPYGTRYLVGRVRGVAGRVALALVGEGNLAAAVLAARAIEEFRPDTLMMVGVAGGLRDEAVLGDVVVGTRIYAYQGGREETGGFRPRPKGWPVSHALDQLAREVAYEGRWCDAPDGEEDDVVPAVHFKPILSGEVVLDSRTSPLAALIANHYGDALAIDMESAGVAEAAHRKDFHRVVAVRGISDTTDGAKREMDGKGWQPRAAANAAAFALALARRIRERRPGDGECPYRGLAAFREQDTDLFFGRGQLTEELTELVSRTRFVAVAGRSGCGKSSLVNAGLLPRLREESWAVGAFRPMPGVPAATALAAGLLPLLQPELSQVEAIPERAVVAEAIRGGRLPELVGEVLAEAGARRLLVSVDQFEEFVAHSEAAAGELCGLLVELATGAVPVHVVLTLRTETLDTAVNRLGLGDVTRKSLFLVTPMKAAQLREAIEAPLERTGLSFEPWLADRILESAADAPAALSLMQFALTRLWEQQDSGLLTHAAYEGFGGVEGAVAHYAETVWTGELSDVERVQARRLLVQLVRPGSGGDGGGRADGAGRANDGGRADGGPDGDGGPPGGGGSQGGDGRVYEAGGGDVVRRTARESELEPELQPIARRLAGTRLVVTGVDGGEVTYDLAHAALARHWRRLGEWLEEEREFRSWQEDLRDSIRRAEHLRGPRLAQALRWVREHPDDITRAERDFISASRKGHRRRTVAWRSGLAAIVALLVLVSAFAVVLRQQTAETSRQLRLNAAHLLKIQARDRSLSTADAAALKTVAAYRASADPVTLTHLAGEYLRYRSTNRLFGATVGDIRQLEMSADGQVVAVLGAGGTALWRLDAPRRAPARYGRGSQVIALSPDGRLLAGVTAQERVEVRDAADPARAVTVLQQDTQASAQGNEVAQSLRFDAQGRRLVAILPRGGLKIWDLERRAPVAVPQEARRLAAYGGQVWFGPDTDTIVVEGKDELVMWRLSTGKATRLSAPHVMAIVSGDGRTAIACGTRTFSAWTLTTGAEPVRRRATGDDRCPMLLGGGHDHLDHAGRIMMTGMAPEGGDDHPGQRATLVDLETGGTAFPTLVAGGSGDPTMTTQFARTPGGTRLITAVGSSVAVADLPSAAFQPVNNLVDGPGIRRPVFSEDARLAATIPSLAGGDLGLWDTTTGQELARTANPTGRVPLLFGKNGRSLLVRDLAFRHLEVLDVPSLRVTSKLPLPVAAAEARPSNEGMFGRFNGLCAEHTADADTVAVVVGGLVSRFDLRRGAQAGRSLQPWRDKDDLARLAYTSTCSIRPGHNEIAVDTAHGVELWDLSDGRRSAVLPTASPSAVADIRFDPSGRHLAALNRDGTLETWDLAGRRPSANPLRVLTFATTSEIADYPASDRIIIRGLDRLRIWDLHRRATIADMDVDVTSAALADRDTLLAWGRNGMFRMAVAPEAWVAHLCRAVDRDFTAAERRSLPPGTPASPPCQVS